MGNRAVITTNNTNNVDKSTDIGIYLHWNGGRDSVEAFLKYCKFRGFRSPSDDNYGWARLCQVIGNFFGGDLSVGIDCCRNLDCNNYDNGVYVIRGWEIVGRRFFDGREQQNYDLYEMLCSIDETQPENDRLGNDKIKQLLQQEERKQNAKK